ncbi:exo-beta-N-acetylmuramidase NamZ domain-containing protein [Ottowia sp.]|uniref:exo-beta-N-acetylmuramidase NamZ family protein n=1 Tax=Ottowia sp. TaxID=1898956 RepID=UPI0039E64B53
MKTGLERFLQDPALRAPLQGRRVALLAHPASVTRDLTHSLDALAALPDVRLTAAFGPQHGLRGDKQDNMVESPDFTDPQHGIPVFSLYGEVRRPTAAMLAPWDVLLVDLQDLGCRIYTFITTLRYVLEAAAASAKAVWVLDRPNPAGRPVEGLSLRDGWESFVGAGPLPMRHGMTMGELGHWFIAHLGLQLEYRVITMEGWQPEAAPGFGWPPERTWINPSPNAANLNMARAYAGTVMLEGTTLSEGRGTTRALELFGAPGLDTGRLLADMRALAPDWLRGCVLRECWFEPTFHKHVGQLCTGVQIHTEDPAHYGHAAFRPWRLQALAFKALRRQQPDYPLWRDFPYEYETRLAIDVINGSPLLREWVDDPGATPADLDALAAADEAAWQRARQPYLLYR